EVENGAGFVIAGRWDQRRMGIAMKSSANREILHFPQATLDSSLSLEMSQPGVLQWVSAQEVNELEHAISRGNLPADLERKLKELSGESLLHKSVEQTCRLFIALIQAAMQGIFRRATEAEKERILRVLAYVRKDEDAIPDYKP